MIEKRRQVRRASDQAIIEAASHLLRSAGKRQRDRLTRPEAADRLGISITTLDRLAKKGRLRPLRVLGPKGRACIRYVLDELEQYERQYQS
jgi:excisionase family DNA binding protein